MRATRAYIASTGTAAVMLGASLALLALVSSFIAFGSWPGTNSGTALDQIVLRSVAASHEATQVAITTHRQSRSGRHGGAAAGTRRHAGAAPSHSTGASRQVASSPSGSRSGSRGSGAGSAQPGQQVQSQVKDTTQQVQNQVQDTTQQVQNQVDNVVNQVTGTGTPAAPPPPQAQTTTPDPVQTVTNTVTGVLGK